MPSSRRSLLALMLLLAVGGTLRAWHASRMAVEHFDEGVYASNLFSDHLDYRYPSRQLYAPPFFPALLEWALILTGAQPHAVMWVNVLLGTLLVAAVWATTRELARGAWQVAGGGPPASAAPYHLSDQDRVPDAANLAALSAAAMVTFGELFIQYSRAALTDVPVCLWMVLAVGSGARSFRTGRWVWAVAAGILTALAWWTKYNGWLPLAILGAGIAGWALFSRPERKQIGNALARWGVIAGGAALLWLPYLWDLQSWGGYAAVAANHRGYLVGASGWLDSLLRHLSVDRFSAKAPTAVGLFLSICIAGRIGSSPAGKAASFTQQMPATVVNGFVAALFLMLPFFIGVEPCLVLGMLAAILFWGASGGRNGFPSAPPLSVWIIAAWVIGLGLTTPLYRPYPRLILPWLTGAIIGNSLAWTWIFTAFRKEATSGPYGEIPSPELLASSDRVRWKATRAGRLLLPAVVLATTLGLCLLPWSSAWQDRRGLKLIASQILDSIQSDLSRRERSTHPHLDCVIYVLAEPGLYYHLAAQEDQRLRFITQPAANLGMLEPGKIEAGVPTYLVSTTGAGKADLLEEKQTDRLQQMERYPYQPSDLVLLDEFPPSALPEVREATVRLLRILPIGGL